MIVTTYCTAHWLIFQLIRIVVCAAGAAVMEISVGTEGGSVHNR